MHGSTLRFLICESAYAAATAKSLQSCPIQTLCDPTDGSPPGSPVPGILQARTLEWVAISFSNAWKWNVKVKSLSRVRLLATPWTAAHQAPLSMGFSRQEYWSGVPLPSQGSAYRYTDLLTPEWLMRGCVHHWALGGAVTPGCTDEWSELEGSEEVETTVSALAGTSGCLHFP